MLITFQKLFVSVGSRKKIARNEFSNLLSTEAER